MASTTAPRSRARRAPLAALALTLALGGATLAACSEDEETTDTGSTTAEQSSGTAPAEDVGDDIERFNEPEAPIEVTVGQQFEIALLTGDPSEGYTWSIETIEPEGIITLEESRPSAIAEGSEEDDVPTSGGGEDVFLFTAEAAGTATITLDQAQQYPGGSTEVPQRTITVEVTD